MSKKSKKGPVVPPQQHAGTARNVPTTTNFPATSQDAIEFNMRALRSNPKNPRDRAKEVLDLLPSDIVLGPILETAKRMILRGDYGKNDWAAMVLVGTFDTASAIGWTELREQTGG